MREVSVQVTRHTRAIGVLGLMALLFLVQALTAGTGPGGLAAPAGPRYFLPFVAREGTPSPTIPPSPTPYACPVTSGNAYADGPVYVYDLDCPVRPAYNHADKNIKLRGYSVNTDPTLQRELVYYTPINPNEVQPPQFATLFNPNKVPVLSNFYRVNNWNWQNPPLPGTRGTPITNPKVTALGLRTTPGEALHVPHSDYDIGGDPGNHMEVIVIFADQDTIALHYTREDTSAVGYTVHVTNICTDPNLLAHYNAHEQAGRYVCRSRGSGGYNLVTLPENQVFGTARGDEIVVAITDVGNFQDPRSCSGWWQIRPGYTGGCPQALGMIAGSSH